MSLIYNGPDVCVQIFEMNKMLRSRVRELDRLIKKISLFIEEPKLKDNTYENIKEYYSKIWIPILEGIQAGCQSMIYGNTAFEHSFVCATRVMNEAYLDTDNIEFAVATWSQYVTCVDQSIPLFDATGSDDFEKEKQQVESIRLLNALYNFDSKSASYFEESIEYFDEVKKGMDLIEIGLWDGTKYQLEGKNMDWAISIHEKANLAKLSDREQAKLFQIGYTKDELKKIIGTMRRSDLEVLCALANEKYEHAILLSSSSVVEVYLKKVREYGKTKGDMSLFEKAMNGLSEL